MINIDELHDPVSFLLDRLRAAEARIRALEAARDAVLPPHPTPGQHANHEGCWHCLRSAFDAAVALAEGEG